MSDDEYETTNVQVAKPKKERTPAQKAATARALEALAAAREAKKAEREAAAAPKASKPRPAAPRPERNVLTFEEEEPAPPSRPRPAARHAPEPKDYGEDIRSLSEGLHSVISYIEQKETKKKAKPKPRKLPTPSSSEEELEPEPEPRKKHKQMKAAPAPPDYRLNHSNPQDVLRNIFWRNM